MARITQPGDDLRHLEQRGPHQRDHHVGLVRVGGGEEQITLLDSRIEQHRHGGAVANNGLDVESIVELRDELSVLLHQNHVVTVTRQLLGERRAHQTAADDHDMRERAPGCG